MGNGGSTATVTDNSAEINNSLSKIRSELDSLTKNINTFRDNIDTHITTVNNKFTVVDYHFNTLQTEFKTGFTYFNNGIKLIENDMLTLTDKHAILDKENKREHWEIHSNDWRERFERLAYQDYYQLQIKKLQLESDLRDRLTKFLILKDKYNDYRINDFTNKMLSIENRLAILNGDSQDVIPYKQPLEINFWQENIPELEANIIELYNSADRFSELTILECELHTRVSLMIANYENTNLVNPFDIPDDILAKKLYNSGVKCIKNIKYKNQDNILILNGYSYIPDYKYSDLIKKFINGCELAKLKLDYKMEDFRFVVDYLYNKVSVKSISNIIEYSKTSIYPLDYSNIYNITIQIHNTLDTNIKFDIGNEYYYEVLKYFTIEKLLNTRYKSISKYFLDNLNRIYLGVESKIDCKEIADILMTSFMNTKLEYRFNKNSIKYADTLFLDLANKLYTGYNKLLETNYKNNKKIDLNYIDINVDIITGFSVDIKSLKVFSDNCSDIGIKIFILSMLTALASKYN